MKNFGRFTLIAVVVLILGMTMTACSSKGGGDNPAPQDATPGQQAASSTSQSAGMVQGSGSIFLNLGQIGLTATTGGAAAPGFKMSGVFQPSPAMKTFMNVSQKFAKSSSVSAAANAFRSAKLQLATAVTGSGTGACRDGGTYDYDITADSATTFSGFIVFTSCLENNTQFDGDYNLSGSTSSSGTILNVTLGDPTDVAFTMTEFGPAYSGLISKTTMTNFSVAYTISSASPAMYDMKATGVVSVHDFINSEDNRFEFKDGYEQVLTGTNTSWTMTTNGDFTESWLASAPAHTVGASFQAFKIDLAQTSDHEDVSLNGQSTIDFTPATCTGGTSTFVTTTPIRSSTTTGLTTQGLVTINPDKAITMTFNPTGTITVNYVGVDKTYNNMLELAQVCPIATLDESAPASTSTLPATVSAVGVNTTISLSWKSADVNDQNNMELHMNYYATQTPDNTTGGTWFLDFDAYLSAASITNDARYAVYNCTNPSGVDLGIDHIDVNGDGKCDIGMDLWDSFLGGPEHMLATKLPAGYYVISVDDYFSAPGEAVPVTVSIQIGSTVFGPFTHTFPADVADAEFGGVESAAAWFAVADMVVDSAGNVTVKAHNAALDLWHDGNGFNMLAPALRATSIQ